MGKLIKNLISIIFSFLIIYSCLLAAALIQSTLKNMVFLFFLTLYNTVLFISAGKYPEKDESSQMSLLEFLVKANVTLRRYFYLDL